MAGKECVRLRERKLGSGNTSLYLDIYRNGERSYEFLKLYIVPERTRMDKETNKQTKQLAEAIKAKRIVEIQNGEYGFRKQNDRAGEVAFFDYMESVIKSKEKEDTEGNVVVWRAVEKTLREYAKDDDIRMKDITPEWLEGYISFLQSKAPERGDKGRALSHNSQATYISKIRTLMRQAMADELITKNPMARIKMPKAQETSRTYLTPEEVGRLARTEINGKDNTPLRNAFLFSCFTGLRWSDINRLTWGQVQTNSNGGCRIVFKQKKTGGLEYLDINKQAEQLMGARRATDEKVFEGLITISGAERRLKDWAKAAGIAKSLSFHAGRHTFAVMMLSLGVDIYTVSKLLGHRNLTTTQIYAKVLDKAKQEAVERIPQIL